MESRWSLRKCIVLCFPRDSPLGMFSAGNRKDQSLCTGSLYVAADLFAWKQKTMQQKPVALQVVWDQRLSYLLVFQ